MRAPRDFCAKNTMHNKGSISSFNIALGRGARNGPAKLMGDLAQGRTFALLIRISAPCQIIDRSQHREAEALAKSRTAA
ncbi:hypothetical protein J2046_001003 [Rhizobium petrolearium]|nr:hypothetical protein [Neorhizobium petrolearium]